MVASRSRVARPMPAVAPAKTHTRPLCCSCVKARLLSTIAIAPTILPLETSDAKCTVVESDGNKEK